MMHMVGYETSASLAVLTPITPIPDGTLRIAGNDFYVPSTLNQVCMVAAYINSSTATLRAQLQSPSLRAMMNFDINPIVSALVGGALPRCQRMWQTPLQLATNEPMDMYIQNAAAVMNRGFVIFCDGQIKPVTGKIYTVRATGTATLVTATWVNTSLTFSQALPTGTYQIVGFRAQGTNLVAARIFFVGGAWRPGVLAAGADDNNDWPDFRYGNIGVWGQFDNTVPPTIDCLGTTDTTQEFYFDLIKTA